MTIFEHTKETCDHDLLLDTGQTAKHCGHILSKAGRIPSNLASSSDGAFKLVQDGGVD
ncbi:MAG: hypothetical protein WC702_03705 [Patescibacteria group bacterium]